MTIQQEIATLKSGVVVYRDEYQTRGWGGIISYSYSPYYKGEDLPLTPEEKAELLAIQQQRIANRARKATPRRR